MADGNRPDETMARPFGRGRFLTGIEMAKFRMAAAMVLAAALAGSPAMAAEAPLAAGKPAGVVQAQRGSPSLLVVAGAALVAVIAVVVATQSSSDAACGSACVVPGTTS
jgi:hypothetical protein